MYIRSHRIPSPPIPPPQVIGVVVADTEAIARRAAKLVVVEYEDLPAVMSCEEVRARGALGYGRGCDFAAIPCTPIRPPLSHQTGTPPPRPPCPCPRRLVPQPLHLPYPRSLCSLPTGH